MPASDPRAALMRVAVFAALALTGPLEAAAQTAADGEIRVRCHVFQTARDAPLVPLRRTVIRVYADWTEEGGPGGGEQLTSLDGTVRIWAGRVELEEMNHVFVRPDLHERVDSVEANISANSFEWMPPAVDYLGLIPVEAIVEFESTVSGETHRYRSTCPVAGLPAAPTLKIDYYFIKAKEWWGLEDEEWWGEIQARGHKFMQESTRFAAANLPVGGLSLRFGGVYAYRRLLFQEVDGEVASGFYEAARRANPGADIIVGITPPSLNPVWQGAMHSWYDGEAHYSFHLGGKRVIFVDLTFMADNLATLTHEIGHFYGLCHTIAERRRDLPPSLGPVPVRPRGPHACAEGPRLHNEGFHLFKGGDYGVNKSETEGNGDVNPQQSVPIVPVMDSGSTVAGWSARFITNEHYERLVRNFHLLGFYGGPASSGGAGGADSWSLQELNDGGPGTGSPWTPLRAREPPDGGSRVRAGSVHPGFQPYLMVSGVVSPDGSVALNPLRVLELDGSPDPRPGELQLEARGPGGDVLERVSFASLRVHSSHAPPDGRRFFEVGVPFGPELAEVVITRGGEVVARVTRSPSAPEVAILSPAPGERWDGRAPLRWEGADADGDALVYDVYYSVDGVRWQPLAIETDETEISWLRPSDLEGGAGGRFRVVALDGFHATSVERAVTVQGGFRLLASSPSAGDTVPDGDGAVSLLFSRAVLPTSLTPQTAVLRDEQGGLVPARIELEEGDDARTVWLLPEGPLRPGASYRVVVGEGLSDRFGERLAEEVGWTFHTRPDRIRPRVIGTQPMPGALGVTPEAPIRLRFSEPIDPTTLTPATIRVEDSAGRTVPGAWSWDDERREAIFEPGSPWTLTTSYRVTLTEAVTDVAGNALRVPEPWTFRTVGRIRPGGER